ncbi:regulator of protease activity HflC (stomatin/prohibitin superfamily) [Kribbella voronezhensis]|uniref:Regulator of protease activity HflC (Stomatin/prohibitin superfamily) n=1 Tax=Kribbella voronezhensis TaxID=2512212 RepID=A0A4V3FKQ8_9ACTN|nr:SPFH domain-containing protein [Kribbella voronezhensis]TDU91153.1 regulator of protease activity HflC (stomatin/prohibitin superfamily) [Kribbella voronezhensis]
MSADVDVMVEMPKPKVTERSARDLNGWPLLGVALLLIAAGIALFSVGVSGEHIALVVVAVLLFLAGLVVSAGLTPVSPGRARVLQILGRYAGTIRTDGLRWVNPISVRTEISTRIRNHETAVAKVNDADGNPIEIAAVVVWQVEDTAQARFEVDDFVEFVAIQTETAVRHIANSYPYDVHNLEGGLSLRDSTDEITGTLSAEIAARVQAAGVHVIESRITHLAYAPEIAQAMLRRQQAGAVVAARQQIVEGAVGMVEMALEKLSERNVVELDEERKATMVSNLMVVLCGDRDAQPVVNTGSLYQ